MGAGRKAASLEIFEDHLKRLLQIIEKLPQIEKEKAVIILRTSADHYSTLSLNSLRPLPQSPLANVTPPSPSIAPSPPLETPSAEHKLATTSILGSSNKSNVSNCRSEIQDEKAKKLKSESEVILDEIGVVDIAENKMVPTELGGDSDVSDAEWDKHVNFIPEDSKRCDICMKIFCDPDDYLEHLAPLSCIICKKEFCNWQYFSSHPETCLQTINGDSFPFKSDPDQAKPFEEAAENESKYKIPKIETAAVAIKSRQVILEPNLNISNEVSKAASSHNDVTTGSPKKRIYKCEECQKPFLTAFQLRKHTVGHANNNCDQCEEKFAKRRLLVNHLKTVHGISAAEKYYSCKFCPRKFVKKPSLWSHYSEHTVGTQVVCNKCGTILDDDSCLETHMKEHRQYAQYTCDRCDEFFVRKQQYLAHLPGHDKYRCHLCDRDFSSKKKLKYHRNFEHDSDGQPVALVVEVIKPSQNMCMKCLKKFKNDSQFKIHKCPKDLKRHENSQELLSESTAIRLGKGRFKCKFCSFEHKKSSAVVRHARIHRNRKRFVCEQCGAAFNAHFTLKEHVAYVHNDSRKYPCEKCPKTFKAKNALIRHAQVHSDKRPHQCHCGQMYKRKSHLRRHLATAHAKEPLDERSNSEQRYTEDMLETGLYDESVKGCNTVLDGRGDQHERHLEHVTGDDQHNIAWDAREMHLPKQSWNMVGRQQKAINWESRDGRNVEGKLLSGTAALDVVTSLGLPQHGIKMSKDGRGYEGPRGIMDHGRGYGEMPDGLEAVEAIRSYSQDTRSYGQGSGDRRGYSHMARGYGDQMGKIEDRGHQDSVLAKMEDGRGYADPNLNKLESDRGYQDVPISRYSDPEDRYGQVSSGELCKPGERVYTQSTGGDFLLHYSHLDSRDIPEYKHDPLDVRDMAGYKQDPLENRGIPVYKQPVQSLDTRDNLLLLDPCRPADLTMPSSYSDHHRQSRPRPTSYYQSPGRDPGRIDSSRTLVHLDQSRGMSHGDPSRGMGHGDPNRGISHNDPTRGISHSDSTRGMSLTDPTRMSHSDPTRGMVTTDPIRMSHSDSSRSLPLIDPSRSLLQPEPSRIPLTDPSRPISHVDPSRLMTLADLNRPVGHADSLRGMSQSDTLRPVSHSDPSRSISELTRPMSHSDPRSLSHADQSRGILQQDPSRPLLQSDPLRSLSHTEPTRGTGHLLSPTTPPISRLDLPPISLSRSQDIDSRQLPPIDPALDDSSYRALADMTYPRLPHYYADQLDSYLPTPRDELSADQGYDKRHKYYAKEKYYGGGRSDEGGLLPPLLALAPSSPPPPSKMDYMCPPGETMSSQYLPDTTIEYY